MDLAHTVRNQDFRQEGQTFRGLKVIPSETGKVNGLEPLLFEKGSIQQNKMLKNRTSRVPNFQGLMVTPIESENSLDSTHNFPKKAKSNNVKNLRKKVLPPGDTPIPHPPLPFPTLG